MSGTSLLILFLLIVGFILFTRRFVPKLWNAEIRHHIVDPININEFKKNPLSYLPDGFFDTTTAKSKCDNCNTIKEQDLHLKKAYLYFEDTDTTVKSGWTSNTFITKTKYSYFETPKKYYICSDCSDIAIYNNYEPQIRILNNELKKMSIYQRSANEGGFSAASYDSLTRLIGELPWEYKMHAVKAEKPTAEEKAVATYTTDEKENIGITGNETIEELAMKVNEVDLMEHKIGVCVLIVTHLELKNGCIGGFTHKISESKKNPPRSPDHIATSLNKQKEWMEVPRFQIREVDVEVFLFFLKKIDESCFMELIKRYEKLAEEEDRKEMLIQWRNVAITIAVIIVIILFYSAMMAN